MGADRYAPFSPYLACPSEQPLAKYGKISSLCSIDSLPEPCLVISVGAEDDMRFEQEILQLTKCEVHTYDCKKEGKVLKEGKHKYFKKCIGPKASQTPWSEVGDWPSIDDLPLCHTVGHVVSAYWLWDSLYGFEAWQALQAKVSVDVDFESRQH